MAAAKPVDSRIVRPPPPASTPRMPRMLTRPSSGPDTGPTHQGPPAPRRADPLHQTAWPRISRSGAKPGLIFRTLLAAVPSDPAGGEPERVRVVPVSVQFQHLGDDSFHGVLLGGHAGEVTQVLLALLNGVRRIGRVDALVP